VDFWSKIPYFIRDIEGKFPLGIVYYLPEFDPRTHFLSRGLNFNPGLTHSNNELKPGLKASP